MGAETQDFGEQRSPPVGVEMGGDFIEKQNRAGALLPFRQQFRMCQDEAKQQRLLLSGRTVPRCERLRSMRDDEIGSVRTVERSRSCTVALTHVAECSCISVFSLNRGEALQIVFDAPFEPE